MAYKVGVLHWIRSASKKWTNKTPDRYERNRYGIIVKVKTWSGLIIIWVFGCFLDFEDDCNGEV